MSLGVHAGAAVERLSHPAVAINWDNMHPYRNGEPLDATWDAIAPYVEHTHFHDAVARPGPAIIRPFGDGDLPLDEMYARLMEANYEGYFSGEWFGDQMDPDDALQLKRTAAAGRTAGSERDRTTAPLRTGDGCLPSDTGSIYITTTRGKRHASTVKMNWPPLDKTVANLAASNPSSSASPGQTSPSALSSPTWTPVLPYLKRAR